jgi:hypothetical protein
MSMQLETITEDPHVARRKFLEYRNAVRDRHDKEDQEIMRGYRALSQGQQLIRLTDTIRAGGTTTVDFRQRGFRDGKHGNHAYRTAVPALAVARAEAEYCWTFGIDAKGSVEMRGRKEIADSNRKDRVIVAGFPHNIEHAARESFRWSAPFIRAIVPKVPPPFRPATSLRSYHILFEAEWGIDPEPPVDPALLKHVGGDLYAVVAVWDLSPLEQAVLAGRRES